MSARTGHLDEAMQSWLHEHSLRETDVQRELRASMEIHPEGEMLTSPEQVQLMALMAKSIGAKRALEVGVFTGYSALGIAAALPTGGTLIACDLSAEFMAIARDWWEKAGVAEKIESRIGPGEESMRALLEEGMGGTIDFIYVDADKPGYETYYELGLELLRPGGIIGLDNMFQGGTVAEMSNDTENTVAIRALARQLLSDDRVDYSLLPVGDGLGIALKR